MGGSPHFSPGHRSDAPQHSPGHNRPGSGGLVPTCRHGRGDGRRSALDPRLPRQPPVPSMPIVHALHADTGSSSTRLPHIRTYVLAILFVVALQSSADQRAGACVVAKACRRPAPPKHSLVRGRRSPGGRVRPEGGTKGTEWPMALKAIAAALPPCPRVDRGIHEFSGTIRARRRTLRSFRPRTGRTPRASRER